MLASLETNRQMRQLNGLRDHNALDLFLCQLMISSLFFFFFFFFFRSKTFIFIHKITNHHDTMPHTLIYIFYPIRPVKPGRRQYLHI